MGFGLLVLAMSIGCLGQASHEMRESTDVDISIKLEHDSKGYYLQITLTNKNTTDLRITDYDLSWCVHQLRLLAIEEKAAGNRVIQANYGIMDPDFRPIIIKSSESVNGKVYLNQYFMNFDKIIASNNVDLFWNYQLKASERLTSKRFGGWIYVPMKK